MCSVYEMLRNIQFFAHNCTICERHTDTWGKPVLVSELLNTNYTHLEVSVAEEEINSVCHKERESSYICEKWEDSSPLLCVLLY